MSTRRLISPPGYGPVVPLEPRAHAGLGLRSGTDHRWSAALNAVFVNTAEFLQAALHYPLAFTRQPGSGEFIPVAVLGLRSGENLFVDPNSGQWAAGRYVPAYVRRYPFCVTGIAASAGEKTRQLICVQADQLGENTAPLFDSHGEPTAQWIPRRELIEAMEAARQHTRLLCRRLDALDLLRPFDAVVVPKQGTRLRLSGLLRVDERRLESLDARHLRTMLHRTELRSVYAHLLSLEHFARLMELTASR